MAATFDPTLPSQRDYMRLALADTDTESPLLDDGTYDALLGANGYAEGLAQAAEAVIAIYTKDPTKYNAGSGDATFDYTQRAQQLRDLVENCRAGNVKDPLGPVRVGISVGQLEAGYKAPPAGCTRPDMNRFRTD